jgi:hypothetical protein
MDGHVDELPAGSVRGVAAVAVMRISGPFEAGGQSALRLDLDVELRKLARMLPLIAACRCCGGSSLATRARPAAARSPRTVERVSFGLAANSVAAGRHARRNRSTLPT